MKKLILVALTVSTMCYTASAQKKIAEGKAVYNLKIDSEDMPEEMMSMMPSEMELLFKNDEFKSSMSLMGGTIMIMGNAKTEKFTTYMDIMGQKMAMEADKTDAEKANKDYRYATVFGTETKLIAGYKCKKATITTTNITNNETFKTDVFFTEEIVANNSASANGAQFKDIKGFLMEYNMDLSGMKMRLTCKEVSANKLDINAFKAPTGYKVMTKAELEKMGSGSGE